MLLFVGHFVERPPSFPYCHVVTKGAGIIKTTAIANVMSLAIIREGGIGDEDYFHSSLMEGGC